MGPVVAGAISEAGQQFTAEAMDVDPVGEEISGPVGAHDPFVERIDDPALCGDQLLIRPRPR